MITMTVEVCLGHHIGHSDRRAHLGDRRRDCLRSWREHTEKSSTIQVVIFNVTVFLRSAAARSFTCSRVCSTLQMALRWVMHQYISPDIHCKVDRKKQPGAYGGPRHETTQQRNSAFDRGTVSTLHYPNFPSYLM